MQELPQRYFYPGDRLAIEGRQLAGLYFIETGRVELYTYHGSRRVHIAYVGANEVIGEIGLLDGNLPSANVLVLEDTCCRFMDKKLFETRILQSDPFIRALLRLFSRRIKRLLALSEHHSEHHHEKYR